MSPADQPYARFIAVLVRGAITELRFPRLCASPQCRRHKRCCDIADRTPRCAKSLHPVDSRRLAELIRMAGDILLDRYPPRPSDDPVTRDREDEAIQMLFDCFDDLPWYQDHILAWHDRYATPQPLAPQPPAPPAQPVPPAPKIDTGALIAEMKETLEHYRMVDEARADTEALKRLAAASISGA